MCLVDIFPNWMSLSERRGRGKDYVRGGWGGLSSPPFRNEAAKRMGQPQCWSVRLSAAFLLAEEEHGEEDEPGEGHGVPEPCGCVDGDLAGFNALEMGEGDEAEAEREDAESQVERRAGR